MAETKTGPEASETKFSGQDVADELTQSLADNPVLQAHAERVAAEPSATAETEMTPDSTDIVDQMERATSQQQVEAALLEAGRQGLFRADRVIDTDQFGKEHERVRLVAAGETDDQRAAGDAVLQTGKDAMSRINEQWRQAPDGGKANGRPEEPNEVLAKVVQQLDAGQNKATAESRPPAASEDPEADRRAAHRAQEAQRHRERQAAENPPLTPADQTAVNKLNNRQPEPSAAKPKPASAGTKPNTQPKSPPPTPNHPPQPTPTPNRPQPQPAPQSQPQPTNPNSWRQDGNFRAREAQKDAWASYEQNQQTTADRVRRDKEVEEKRRAADQRAAEATYAPNIEATRRREALEIRDDEPLTRATDVRRAQSEALALDPEAQAQFEVRQRFQEQTEERVRQFQQQIDQAERANPNLARELRTARDAHVAELNRQGEAAVRAEKAKQDQITKETAKAIAETVVAAGNHELSNHALRFPQEALRDPAARQDFENRALLRRQALGVEPVPFMERRRGGFFRLRSSERGPRTLESYYRVPGQENMVVVERHNRRTGDLISQQLLTSREQVRGNGIVDALPPRDISDMVDAERAADNVRLNTSPSRGRWTRLRDAVGGPGTGRLTQWDGAYSHYVEMSGDATTVDRNRDALNRWNRYGKKRGGVLYWLGLRGGRR